MLCIGRRDAWARCGGGGGVAGGVAGAGAGAGGDAFFCVLDGWGYFARLDLSA